MNQQAMLLTHSTENATDKFGLAYWMGRTVQECDRAASDFAPDPVHDLRVALRRCRSIAEGFQCFDPCRTWGEMRKAGGRLFKRLGDLRDTQVMMEWMKNPEAPKDAASGILQEHLAGREIEQKRVALGAIIDFDIKKWIAWNDLLSERASRIPIEGMAFRHLVLERWSAAHSLHRQALRNRTHAGFHRLRIGLKKFRYTVENFLPTLCAEWGPDLQELQDLLGEMHDLRVLLQTVIDIGASHSRESLDQWRSWAERENRQRLDRYRQKMIGRDSLWRIWRAGLPQGENRRSAAMARLETWASFRDPDCKRSKRVTQVALRLYDRVPAEKLAANIISERSRLILELAGMLHAVGASRRVKKPHKRSYQRIKKLQTPLGLAQEDFEIVRLVVRCHRGPFPAPGQKGSLELTGEKRQTAMVLAGILRLAVRLAALRRMAIPRIEVARADGALVILVNDFDQYSPLARKLARDRYLLEIACGFPVVIRRG
jgi:CHAD domain-containing protein